MKSRESRESRKTNAFKVTPELDRAYKALFGPEEEESYHNRLKKSAQRVVFGKPGPIACWDCGLEDQAILEIHHILDDDSRISGNYLRRNVHGAGNEFYRYILSSEKDQPKMVLLCPTCHARRHRSYHKYDKSDHNSCNLSEKYNKTEVRVDR